MASPQEALGKTSPVKAKALPQVQPTQAPANVGAGSGTTDIFGKAARSFEKTMFDDWMTAVDEKRALSGWQGTAQDVGSGVARLGWYAAKKSLPALAIDATAMGVQGARAAPGERVSRALDSAGWGDDFVQSIFNPAGRAPVIADKIYADYQKLSPEHKRRIAVTAKNFPKGENARFLKFLENYEYTKGSSLVSGAFSAAAPSVPGNLALRAGSMGANVLAGMMAPEVLGDDDDTARDVGGQGQIGAAVAGLGQTAAFGGVKGAVRGLMDVASSGNKNIMSFNKNRAAKVFEGTDIPVTAGAAAANRAFPDTIAALFPKMTSEQQRLLGVAMDNVTMETAKPIVKGMEWGAKRLKDISSSPGGRAEEVDSLREFLRKNFADEKARVSEEFYAPLDREVLAPFDEGGKSMDWAKAKSRLQGVIKDLEGHDLPGFRKLKSLIKTRTPDAPDPVTGRKSKQIAMMDLENARSELQGLTRADGIEAGEKQRLLDEMDAILSEQLGGDYALLLKARKEYEKVIGIYKDDKGGSYLGGLTAYKKKRQALPENIFAKLFRPGTDTRTANDTAGLFHRLARAAGKGDVEKGGLELMRRVNKIASDEQAVRLFDQLRTQQLRQVTIGDDAMELLADRAFVGYLGVSKAVIKGDGGAIEMMNRITPRQIKAIREHAITSKHSDPALVDRAMQSAYMMAKFDDLRAVMKNADAADGKLDPDEVNEAMLRGFRKLLGSSEKDKRVFDAIFEAKAGDEISPRQRFEFFGMMLDGAMRIKRGQSASEIVADSEWYKHADETSKQILAWIRQYYFPISPVAVISGMATRQLKKHAHKNKVDAIVQDLLRPGLESDKVAKSTNKLIKLFRLGKANSAALSREMDRAYRAAAEHNDDGATLMGRKEDEE